MTEWKLGELTKAALAIAAVLQVLSMLDVLDSMVVAGFVALPWSTIPALVALCTLRIPNVRLNVAGAIGLGVLAAATGLSALSFALDSGTANAAGVIATAVVEEVTFRLAIPLVLLALLVKVGMHKAPALALSLSISAVLFVLLPGHLQQLDSLGTSSVFLAFAAIMSYAVWRSGLLLPAIAAHSTINFVTLFGFEGALATDMRGWIVAATLIALMLVSVSAAENHEELVIDLRDSVLEKESERSDTPNSIH